MDTSVDTNVLRCKSRGGQSLQLRNGRNPWKNPQDWQKKGLENGIKASETIKVQEKDESMLGASLESINPRLFC